MGFSRASGEVTAPTIREGCAWTPVLKVSLREIEAAGVNQGRRRDVCRVRVRGGGGGAGPGLWGGGVWGGGGLVGGVLEW